MMVQNVTSTPKRRSRCARSTVQMLVVGHSLRMTRRSQRRAPRPPSIISTHAKPQSLPTAAGRSARMLVHQQACAPARTHQLNDCRTCGTSTVWDWRSCSAASSSADGACARALRARHTSAAARERQTPQGTQRTYPVAVALLRVTRRSSEGASRPLLAAAGEAQAEARRTLHATPSEPAILAGSARAARALCRTACRRCSLATRPKRRACVGREPLFGSRGGGSPLVTRHGRPEGWFRWPRPRRGRPYVAARRTAADTHAPSFPPPLQQLAETS